MSKKISDIVKLFNDSDISSEELGNFIKGFIEYLAWSEDKIIIKNDDMYWNIIATKKQVPGYEEGKTLDVVELQWGWTAGFDEETLKNLADDAPQGHDTVTTTLEGARSLRDQLNKIINEHDVKDVEAEVSKTVDSVKDIFKEFNDKLSNIYKNLSSEINSISKDNYDKAEKLKSTLKQDADKVNKTLQEEGAKVVALAKNVFNKIRNKKED